MLTPKLESYVISNAIRTSFHTQRQRTGHQTDRPRATLERGSRNEFLRQFELKVENEMAIIEYSLQERKIFLTKLIIPDTIRTREFELEFVDMVFSNIKERNISVVPTSPEIAKFVRGNRKYKRMLPVGIRI